MFLDTSGISKQSTICLPSTSNLTNPLPCESIVEPLATSNIGHSGKQAFGTSSLSFYFCTLHSPSSHAQFLCTNNRSSPFFLFSSPLYPLVKYTWSDTTLQRPV